MLGNLRNARLQLDDDAAIPARLGTQRAQIGD